MSSGRSQITRIGGLLILIIVAAVYVLALSRGHWPPSHPWSGISLTLLGALVLMPPQRQRARALRLAVAALALISALFWAGAVFLKRGP